MRRGNTRKSRRSFPGIVNGTIGEHDRPPRGRASLLCADCRDELALDRRIYRSATAETAVEYMPAASLKRLQARLDGMDAAASGGAPCGRCGGCRASRRVEGPPLQPLRWLMAASVAVMALALSLSAADRWLQIAGARGAIRLLHGHDSCA